MLYYQIWNVTQHSCRSKATINDYDKILCRKQTYSSTKHYCMPTLLCKTASGDKSNTMMTLYVATY